MDSHKSAAVDMSLVLRSLKYACVLYRLEKLIHSLIIIAAQVSSTRYAREILYYIFVDQRALSVLLSVDAAMHNNAIPRSQGSNARLVENDTEP
jgi:hypothetical protein